MDAKINVKNVIKEMQVDDIQEFDIELLDKVRSYASSVGLAYNREYQTTTDRRNGVITVVRKK